MGEINERSLKRALGSERKVKIKRPKAQAGIPGNDPAGGMTSCPSGNVRLRLCGS